MHEINSVLTDENLTDAEARILAYYYNLQKITQGLVIISIPTTVLAMDLNKKYHTLLRNLKSLEVKGHMIPVTVEGTKEREWQLIK